jgi:hypothetical protein
VGQQAQVVSLEGRQQGGLQLGQFLRVEHRVSRGAA